MIGIYLIKNILNNKVYIGSSVNVERRFQEHLRALRRNKHFNRKFQFSFNKNGESNFEFKILKELNEISNLEEIETLYIRLYKSFDYSNGYNTLIVGSSPLGIKRSEETKLNMSKAQKGRIITEEARIKISNTLKGHTYNKGIPKTKEHSLKVSKTLKEKYPKGSKVGRAKPVYQYTLDNIFINEYHSIEKAAIEVGITSQKIRHYFAGSVNNNTGYIWKRNKE